MFNPFHPLLVQMVNGLKGELKRPYLVSQTLRNAPPDPNGRTNLLMTDYDDLTEAKIHHNSVKNDKYLALLQLNEPAHYNKLVSMIGKDSKYCVYSSFITDKRIEKTVLKKYEGNVRGYISRATNWQLPRDTNINITVELIFGEFFVILKHGTDKRQFRLEELEKY